MQSFANQLYIQPCIYICVDTLCPELPRCSSACAVEAKTRSVPQQMNKAHSFALGNCNRQECQEVREEGRRLGGCPCQERKGEE